MNAKFEIWLFPPLMCRRSEPIRTLPPGGAPPPCSLTYLSKLARGDVGARHHQIPKFIELI